MVKSAIFDAVNEALVEQGRSPEEARQAAEEAQAYSGDNLDMMALGGVLGYAATRFGVQPALMQKKLGDRLIKEGVAPAVARTAVTEAAAQETLERGVLSNLGRTAASEAVPEAAQAGQEQFAQNLALRREDMDVPLMRGVVGSAALEGGIGALLGGGVGAVEAQRADTEIAERQAARAAQTAFEEEPAAVTEEQRQADADAVALFLEGTIEPTPIETAAPLTIDGTAQPAAREWEPVIAAEIQNDSQGEIDRDVIIEKRLELAETYGEEAAAAYGRAMMDALTAQLRAQQEAPAARAAQQTQFEADEAEAARLAGESIAARMAAEQAAAAPTVEPVTEQTAPVTPSEAPIKERAPSVKFTGKQGYASNESVSASLREIEQDDDIALEFEDRVGSVLLQGIDRTAGGKKGRATAVLKEITNWADANNKPLVLMPSGQIDGSKDELKAWYERNGFVVEPDGAMVRQPAPAVEEAVNEQVAPTPAVEPVTVAQPATPTGATLV